MGIGASGRRGDETRGRGRGRMGWIRMLTGERMRREQENAGATSASRMPAAGQARRRESRAAGEETGRIGEAEVVQRSAAVYSYAQAHEAGMFSSPKKVHLRSLSCR
uniref:Uncharacterized protein n=1 Tax=Oryza glaberrima TaxID=4538 RepID=I1NYV4_ORYGL